MLKTDYKDDVFTGNRKYNIIENSDGTKSLEDVTDYVQEGNTFSANDINTTNSEVNALKEQIGSIDLSMLATKEQIDNLNYKAISQTDYDALTTKNAGTMYFIYEDTE